MDEVELLVLEAWERVGERVMGDAEEVEKRRGRMRGKTMSRPPREWCLALRANDLRLAGASGEFDAAAARGKRAGGA